jgi:hypothetical protein
MSFLSPGLLALLAPLVALPLVLHLLNKGFPRHFKFPSIELIKETVAQRTRIQRWRHWILLLLRTAFLLLLLLAFLRPVVRRFGANPGSHDARHVLIVVDHSLSMEYKGSGPASRERAVHEATKLIESLGSKDAVNILLMDARPAACFVEFSSDFGEARRFLAQLRPGLTRGDVNLATATAAQLVSKTVARPEVYFISDFQRKNWANASFTALPPAAKLFFVDVGPALRDNHAILDAKLSQNQVLAGDTAMLEIRVGNFSAADFTGRISVNVDKHASVDQEVSIAPWSEARVTVPVVAGGPGVHLCDIRLPDDALTADNHFRLTLAVQEKEEVLIVTDRPVDAKGSAFFLKTALNPYEHEAGSLLPRVITSAELTPARLAGVRKMFFTQLNQLNTDACTTTTEFLFRGGGLIYFLDGAADAENVTTLGKVIGPGTLPMRLTQRRTATNVVSGAQQIVRGDFKSPYLKLFQGAARQNLGLLEFYDYYQASTTGAGSVLLTYADESPAMGAAHHGLGTLLLMNFPASEFSGNLPRQRLFPAWMQELVKAVSTDEPPPTSFPVGEPLHTEAWRSELRDQDFLSPAGVVVPVKRELTGERVSVSFTPEELGFYTLGKPRVSQAFGINASSDESDLRPIEQDVLPKEFAGDREAHFVAGAEAFDELAKGRPLFHWFILAGVAFLLLESGFQFLLKRNVERAT